VIGTGLLLAAAIHCGARFVAQPDVAAEAPKRSRPKSDPEALRRDLVTLVERFPQRSAANPAILEEAARWLEVSLREAGARTASQPFVVDGRTYRNVIARLGPESGARLVIGAHYDAALDLPGADDDASGVAGLLAIARALGETPPSRPVELVAFCLEEPPHFATDDMGSVHHARALKEAGVEVEAMISLEMIGYFDDRPGSQRFPLPGLERIYPTTGNFVALVGDLGSRPLLARVKAAFRGGTDLPVESIAAPRSVTGVDWSDHRSYWAVGYPAIMVTDTSFLRNARYHTADDLPDSLDYVRMAKIVDGVMALID
jgi:hypothetical protein